MVGGPEVPARGGSTPVHHPKMPLRALAREASDGVVAHDFGHEESSDKATACFEWSNSGRGSGPMVRSGARRELKLNARHTAPPLSLPRAAESSTPRSARVRPRDGHVLASCAGHHALRRFHPRISKAGELP